MRARDRSGSQPPWRRYLRFWGPDVGEDVDEELSFHLEMLVEEYVAAGMAPEAARQAAGRRFGDSATARPFNANASASERRVRG
jgi:hypothetical protein